ncbi:hypothetical protein J4E90_003765 [Alternaria incomplexa]|uniref:uncharacterized protein n=1 Tax=Alternaria incomplexa TaxID=1187928 RepID=UPI00221FA7B6|nr:uncharacterized protein J4E90_003765 [Alternaria incomplexa]KAI4917258.1 hypothetical protein J4E90_003765 [Alternaria incomplexa]
MAPPWVTFDSIATWDGDCANGAEPDIAGVGVVLSFVIASFMTTFASILAMLLDQAFDTKGHFTPRAPLTYIRERFLENEWKKHYAWRPFLDPLIIGFGDQQLITGYAVLLSGWIKVAQGSFRVQGSHFVLILYVCALSSSSHLAALITLRKYFRKYKLIAKIRLTLVVFFAVFLLTSMIAAIAMPPILVEGDDGTSMILLAILSAILVLTQKFARPEDPDKFCGLQDDEENIWGFGQTLSVVMLLLPAITALQTYLEARQDIKKGFTRTHD